LPQIFDRSGARAVGSKAAPLLDLPCCLPIKTSKNQIVQACGPSRLIFDPVQHRQQQCGKNTNDRKNRQQLDQGEPYFSFDVSSHASLDNANSSESRRRADSR